MCKNLKVKNWLISISAKHDLTIFILCKNPPLWLEVEPPLQLKPPENGCLEDNPFLLGRWNCPFSAANSKLLVLGKGHLYLKFQGNWISPTTNLISSPSPPQNNCPKQESLDAVARTVRMLSQWGELVPCGVNLRSNHELVSC